jgi:hypothetical protein
MNKNTRLIPQLAGSLLCLILLVMVLQSLTADIPHHYARGERLQLSKLTHREMIVVQESGGDRGPRLMQEYRIKRLEQGFQSTATSGHVGPQHGHPVFVRDDDPVVRVLSERQVQGLQEMLAYFSEQEEERSSANETTHVRYFRGDEEIGEELFVGYHLDGDLAYCRRELRKGNYQLEDVYTRIWETFRVPPARVALMTAFAELLEDPHASRREDRNREVSGRR